MHSERNNQQNEKNLWDKKIIFQIIHLIQSIKKLKQLNNKITNNLSEKWMKDLNFFFQLGHRYMKRCSRSLIIRDMQIKVTIRYHLITVKTAIIKKSKGVNVDKDVHC